MRFSIVAPLLNEMPPFQTLFLPSLKDQSFTDYECIIVDGGSWDGSREKAEELAKEDNRFRCVVDLTRNIGFIRNVGARFARGEIILQTSADTYFPPFLLEELNRYYLEHPQVAAVAGRTFPTTSIIAHLGYGAFDTVRYLMTKVLGKLRPSGNFLSIERSVFEEVGGYPEVTFSEDGLFGRKLDGYKVAFDWNLYIVHHVKRFEHRGSLNALMFYLPSLARIVFPFLDSPLSSITRIQAAQFVSRSDLK